MGTRSYFPNSSSCSLCSDCDQAFEHLVNMVFVAVSVASSMVAEQFVTREVSIKLGEEEKLGTLSLMRCGSGNLKTSVTFLRSPFHMF